MRALLVNPLFPPTYWGMEHTAEFTGKAAMLPPLGLLTVAALLPREWEVRLVDMNVEPLPDEALAWADLVMLGGMRIQQRSFHEVAARARALGKRTVAGGAYVTTDPGAAQEIDHLVVGEAEQTLPSLARALERGDAPRLTRAPGYPDVTASPVPRFELARADRYNSFGVQFSRGCPFRCEFCDIIEMFGRVPRTKSPAQVIAELDAIRATGFRGSLFLVDDNFIGNKVEARRLLPELAAWQAANRRPFDFFTEASLNLAVDDALIDAMVDAGFSSVFLGIESPSREALEAAGKRQNLAVDPAAAVEKLARRGLEVMAGFIIGFDGDGADVFDRQIDFINASPIGTAMVGMLAALPGTQLWRRLEREGRLRDAGDGDNMTATNFVTRMPEADLIAGYRRVLGELYAPRAYFSRALRHLALLPRRRGRAHRRAPSQALRCLGLSLVKQGLFSRYRAVYWSFLLGVLVRAPRRFAEAIALAIRGDHLIRYTDEQLTARLDQAALPAPAPAATAPRRRLALAPSPTGCP